VLVTKASCPAVALAKADDSHVAVAFGAEEGVELEDFLHKARPSRRWFSDRLWEWGAVDYCGQPLSLFSSAPCARGVGAEEPGGLLPHLSRRSFLVPLKL
jgi:hypothetical protein